MQIGGECMALSVNNMLGEATDLYIVTFYYEDATLLADKTFDEVKSALEAGKNVIGILVHEKTGTTLSNATVILSPTLNTSNLTPRIIYFMGVTMKGNRASITQLVYKDTGEITTNDSGVIESSNRSLYSSKIEVITGTSTSKDCSINLVDALPETTSTTAIYFVKE